MPKCARPLTVFAGKTTFLGWTLRSIESFVDSLDSSIYREFRQIAEYIRNTKREIGHLEANDLRSKHIPEAGHELDEVITATEDATTKIMECAKTVLDADTSDPEAYQQVVSDNVMINFKTCSFQDLTGQRIAKAVETLEHIEARVGRFAAAIGAFDTADADTPEQSKRKKRKKDLLVNGPVKSGEGVSQDDVDALLNS